jgi:hypothetical protein
LSLHPVADSLLTVSVACPRFDFKREMMPRKRLPCRHPSCSDRTHLRAWLGREESNPHAQIQSLLSYH